jgi:DnaJ-class molecular chaperone
MSKCKICKGIGVHKTNNDSIKGYCYYCNGTGKRVRKYKRLDLNENVDRN